MATGDLGVHQSGHASTGDGCCLELDARSDAARVGRRFVEERVRELGLTSCVDDAALVAAELLANSLQHGEPPVTVCVRPDPPGLRVEVTDGSPRSPVRPAPSSSNMTGRGLTLVEALTARWGVERASSGGKTVWAQLPSDPSGQAVPDLDLDQILAEWDDDLPTAEQRYTVVLGDVPTDLLIEAKAHIDNLVREFSLAAASDRDGDASVPQHLAELIETVVHGFGDARAAIKRQALTAAANGETRTRLVLNLPASAAAAGEAYLAALDDADEYARAARLLTLETPPDHRLFRHWYVEAVVHQLRRLAVGDRPDPVAGFNERLIAEVRRLSIANRATDRLARLQRVTAGLARSRTPEDVAAVVVSEGVVALGASGGGLLVPDVDGEHLAVPGVVGYGVELVDQFKEERLDAPLPAATALRTGEPVWLESQAERDARFPMLRGFESETVAMCAVPLILGSRSLGALRFSFRSRKLFDDQEREFVLALAAQTAQTLQRAELYEAERKAALDLQRALLPDDISGIPGWDVAAYYSPAGRQEVGGDFYDVIRLTDGRIAAVVGDVMGRGVEAAAAMAQVRSTVRAYAVDDPEPASVFRRVDRFFEALDLEQLVTVLYFLADPHGDTVRIGSAGHLQPLLLTGGQGRLVETATGTPFGVGGVEREVVEITLPAGAALVAVTDGLVERRGEDIDAGVERVLQAAGKAAGTSAREVLDVILAAAAADRAYDDDVTVLVLRRQ